jgi:hypothetical protein
LIKEELDAWYYTFGAMYIFNNKAPLGKTIVSKLKWNFRIPKMLFYDRAASAAF